MQKRESLEIEIILCFQHENVRKLSLSRSPTSAKHTHTYKILSTIRWGISPFLRNFSQWIIYIHLFQSTLYAWKLGLMLHKSSLFAWRFGIFSDYRYLCHQTCLAFISTQYFCPTVRDIFWGQANEAWLVYFDSAVTLADVYQMSPHF